MEKLTDNEIIKALKKMIDLMCCEDDWQRASTIEDALDLINRLKAESKGYRYKAQTQKGELARLYKQNAEQKAEIERLNLENLQMVASIKSLKVEAIKEFAERSDT